MCAKVPVKIFGQEYTITGDKSEIEILEIAEYVDRQIRDICKVVTDRSTANLAILGAINITEDYFDLRTRMESLEQECVRLKEDNAHYAAVWEKSKEASEQKNRNIDELKQRIHQNAEKLKELQDKCREYENGFFDLQMENIQLKSELGKLKEKTE